MPVFILRVNGYQWSIRHRRDLVLEVADDGITIDKQTLLPGRAGYFGLVGMRERAERIGAVLDIRSSKAGTLVQLVMPRNSCVQNDAPDMCRFALKL